MKRTEFVVCPCCGDTKVIYSAKRPNRPFDIYATEFIQIREGGGKTGTGKKGRGQGRGVGWVKIPELSMSVEQAIAAGGEYSLLAQEMANQIDKIHKKMKRLGLIK